MFKNSNFLSDKKLWIVIFIVAVLGIAMYMYSSKKQYIMDNMESGGGSAVVPASLDSNYPPQRQQEHTTNSSLADTSLLKPVADPSELLPRDENSEWASLNPSVNGNIQTPDLLQSGYHIGINTVGQTMKNATYDLRSDPIIEKKNVSPWNMSTIEPDLARVPLEIGYGQR